MRHRNRTPEPVRDRIMALADGAACRGSETLYTAEARHLTKGAVRAMQQVCSECPVLVQCAELADQIKPTCGVWAGKLYTTSWRTR